MTQKGPAMDDLGKLIERLSQAQRRVLLAMSEGWQRPKEIPAAPSTLYSLWDFARDYSTPEESLKPPVMLVHRDICDSPLCYEWQLTDLGKQVAAALRARNTP